MKVLLDIQDEKVAFILEVLKHFKCVKVEPLVQKEELVAERTKFN